MKRIFIIQNTPIGAPLPLSIYLTSLLEHLASDKNYELNLIITKSDNIPIEIKRLCKKIYEFDGSTYSIKDNLKFSFFVKKILFKEQNEKKIDILHCLYPNSSLLGAVMFKHKNKTAEIIYDVRSPWIDMSVERGFVNQWVSGVYRKVLYAEEKFLCNRVDKFIFITQGLYEYYAKKCNLKGKPVLISPSGIDLHKFKKAKSNVRAEWGISSEAILIGSVGGIAKVRKLQEFMSIFKLAVQKNTQLKLMLIGEGDALQELKNFVKHENLENYVIFVGSVPHLDIPNYMSSFDFGLCHLPNIFIYENSVPIKVLEYLACDIPVVCSELPAHSALSKELSGIYIYHDATDFLSIVSSPKKHPSSNLNKFDWRNIANNYKLFWSALHQ